MNIYSYIIGLGSSRGLRHSYLGQALRLLEHNEVELRGQSPWYGSAPFGGVAQNIFLNQVIWVSCTRTPDEMLQLLQKIEITMGRKRELRWDDREIDLDLLYGWTPENEFIKTNSNCLILPHPEISKRWFVMVPLTHLGLTKTLWKDVKIDLGSN